MRGFSAKLTWPPRCGTRTSSPCMIAASSMVNSGSRWTTSTAPTPHSLVKERYPAGMPIQDVCAVVTAVAAALDYAHQQGLLHRDVKPANILVTDPQDGKRRILLADFGIARPIGDISGLTATNFTVGTLTYAAPEQLMGSDIDGRADQYALAATAFHLLTGAPPYQHSNPVAVISQHLTAPLPKLSDRRPELTSLDEVLSRGLAKDPADRFERCSDLAAALTHRAGVDVDDDHLTETGITVAAPIAERETQVAVRVPSAMLTRAASPTGIAKRRRRSRILLGAAIATVLVTAIGVVGFVMRPTKNTASTSPASAPAPDLPQYSTARTASTTTTRSKRSTVPRTPFTPPTPPVGGPFTRRADPPDALPRRPSWIPRTTEWRTPRPSQPNYRFVDGHWQSAPVQRQLGQPRCLGTRRSSRRRREYRHADVVIGAPARTAHLPA